MKKEFLVLMVSVAAFIPGVAFAEMASGSLTLGYESGKLAGARAHALTFDGVVSARLGNNVSLNARANALRGKINGVAGHANAHLLGMGLAYSLNNGGWVGAYLENGGISASGIAGSLDYTQFGLEGGFKAAGADVTGFVGRADDIDSVGFSAKYSEGSRYQIGGGAIHSRIDTGVGKQTANYFGVAGAMKVSGAVSLFGGIAHTTVNGTGSDVTSFGLGAAYDLGSRLGGSSVSLELGRSSIGSVIGSGHMNMVRVGLTIPLGRGSSAVPQNSVAGAVLNPTKNTVSQTVLSAF